MARRAGAAVGSPGVLATAGDLGKVVPTPGPYGHPFYFHVYKTVEMIAIALVVSVVVGSVVGVALGTTSRPRRPSRR